MARCRTLFQENQELGKQVSQGKVAQLEAEIAVQKEVNEELKNSQDGKTPPQVSSVSLEELKATALCTIFSARMSPMVATGRIVGFGGGGGGGV